MITHKPRDQSQYRTGCSGKLRFKSARDAARKRKKIRQYEGETLNIYRCKYCDHYHLGHKSY